MLFVWPIFSRPFSFSTLSPSLPYSIFKTWSFPCGATMWSWFGKFGFWLLWCTQFCMSLWIWKLAGLLCVLCWAGNSFVASQLGLSLAWKVNHVVVFCWYEHGSISSYVLLLWIHGESHVYFSFMINQVVGFLLIWT